MPRSGKANMTQAGEHKAPTLRRAQAADAQRICELVQQTIREIYPLYYPAAVVSFFGSLHSLDAITADIASKTVLLLEDGKRLVGTGTLSGNHITRVFVAPRCQGQGYGTALLDKLEAVAGSQTDTVLLDASLPAARFYEHRGYSVTHHELFEVRTQTGSLEAVLVYPLMQKTLSYR